MNGVKNDLPLALAKEKAEREVSAECSRQQNQTDGPGEPSWADLFCSGR